MTASHRNNVKILGSGDRTLMFAHGYGCDQNMWRHVVPSFTDDFKVVLFDYVGSGLSDAAAFDRTRYSTLRGYAQDVIEIIEELNLHNVHFVGHSVSSMIGALAAIEQPEYFASLTMIGPSPCYINSGDYKGGMERGDVEDLLESLESNHVAWSATMAPVIMGNPETPELADELQASFCRMNPFLANHFARVTFLSDNRSDLVKVRTNTLIVQCRKDAIAGTSVGEYVHKCLPTSEFVMIDATGHCPHMSAPKEVVKALQNFLHEKPFPLLA
ncbi:alpha/beta fold hydrolase [Tunturiibacter gelidoferens]|uniref:alpha/beta fold hydrolase n=1 Tax=Tunturiibacter gelidiferens TaxID=3069689 RepID=UPI0015CBE023|nr:alpha/beta hydrolase [Edaphobacter lichenicola]